MKKLSVMLTCFVLLLSSVVLLATEQKKEATVIGGSSEKVTFTAYVTMYYLQANAGSGWKIVDASVSGTGWLINTNQSRALAGGQISYDTEMPERFSVVINGTIAKGEGDGPLPTFSLTGDHDYGIGIEVDPKIVPLGKKVTLKVASPSEVDDIITWTIGKADATGEVFKNKGKAFDYTAVEAGEYVATVNYKSVKFTVVKITFDLEPVDSIIKGETPVPVKVTVLPSTAADKIVFSSANESIITVAGTAPNITVAGVGVGSSTIIAKLEDIKVGQDPANVIANNAFTGGTVAGDATPSHQLSGNELGYCEVEYVEPNITVGRSGSNWKAILTSATGHYSFQAALPAGVTEVTGPGGNTTESNWKKQNSDLDTCPVGLSWYMVAAIEAHERVHETHMLPTFKSALSTSTFEDDIEKLYVSSKSYDKAAAIEAIKNSQAYKACETTGALDWYTDYHREFPADHAGPTTQAEDAVVDPMINRILNYANTQGWQ